LSTTRVTGLQAEPIRIAHNGHAGRAQQENQDLRDLFLPFSISFCIYFANCQCPTVSWNLAADSSKSRPGGTRRL